MRRFLLLLLVLTSFHCYSQNVSVCSWNIKDFGKSKSKETIEIIAKTLKSFDIIAVQEVVAGYGGPKAVAKLADQLNRSGAKWEYAISNATSGSSYKSERYAFIWKTSRVKKNGEPWLEQKYGQLIDREPFFGRFKVANKTFTLVSYHAITKSKQPEREIKYFKFLPPLYPNDNLIFCGDFNVPQSHSVFYPLRKMGYEPSLVNQKTSLRQKCIDDDCLASEFDNFFYNKSRINLISSGIIHFYKAFDTLKVARSVSDHVPIFFNFSLKG